MASRLLLGLNDRQLEAVTTTEGPLLVLAGAGTGKTRVVTVRIAHLIDGGVPASRILAVTFTNKAAREMRRRVEELATRAAVKALTVSTFHSFAVRLLREYAERLGYRKTFSIADEDDVATLLRTALRELGVTETVLNLKGAAALIGAWKAAGKDAEQALDEACDDREIHAAHAYRRLADEMRHRSVVDFDDMLLLAVKLLREHPDVLEACRDRYRYLMVDEYQDTNAGQYDLVRQLAGERRNLCVVGDDDQSIYGWRGARAGNILDFSRHYPGAKVVTLDQNYRSTNRILRAANGVIVQNAGRREKNLWSALGEGSKICVYRADDEEDEVRWIVSGVADAVNDGVPHSDVAVLFRANVQSAALEIALRKRRIPYRIAGVNSLFDRREVRDVLAYLKVATNPRDDGAMMRVINTPPRGIGRAVQARLVAMASERRGFLLELIQSGVAADAAPKCAEAINGLKDLFERLRSRGEESVRDALEALIEDISYRAFLAQEYPDPLDAQMRGAAIDQLIAAAAGHDRRQGGGIAEFLESLALDRDLREDEDEAKSGVALMTVHAAKGLEFQHVWLAGVEEGIFPHKNSFGDDERLDSIDEERRLFYVAVTRARRELAMSWSKRRSRFGRVQDREMSRFVGEIDDELLTFSDAASLPPVDDAEDYFAQLRAMMGGKPGHLASDAES